MKKCIFLLLICSVTMVTFAQIPQDAITYTYDASGNRTARIVPMLFFPMLPPVLPPKDGGIKAKTVKGGANATEVTSSNPYVEEIRNLRYQIYPNPTVDNCIVEIKNLPNELSNSGMQLYSSDGKLLWQQKNLDATNSIDLTSLSSGMYVLRVLVNGQATSFKIVKQQ